MGLGKTLIVLALVSRTIQNNKIPNRRHNTSNLIIVPLSSMCPIMDLEHNRDCTDVLSSLELERSDKKVRFNLVPYLSCKWLI
jgi:hypothetical protein